MSAIIFSQIDDNDNVHDQSILKRTYPFKWYSKVVGYINAFHNLLDLFRMTFEIIRQTNDSFHLEVSFCN